MQNVYIIKAEEIELIKERVNYVKSLVSNAKLSISMNEQEYAKDELRKALKEIDEITLALTD